MAKVQRSGLFEEEARVFLFPGEHFIVCGFLGQAMAFLQATEQLLALALNDVQVVVGQLAPLLLDLECGRCSCRSPSDDGTAAPTAPS